MGFLDTPQSAQRHPSAPTDKPRKLSIEKVEYDNATAWRYECPDRAGCDKYKMKHNKRCNGFILLVQDDPPKDKTEIKKCFYAMDKLTW